MSTTATGTYRCIVPNCGKPARGLQCDECREGKRSPEQREQVPSVPAPAAKAVVREPAAPTTAAPERYTLTFPWSMLVSDNKHRSFIASREDHKAYKAARDAMHAEALKQCTGGVITGEVELRVTVWVPDMKRRDIGNLRKALTDALSGAAYGDDSQLAAEHWLRGGLDRDHPRAEITVTPFKGER